MPRRRVDRIEIPNAEPQRNTWPYMHIIVDPEVVQRIRQLAARKGYKLGEMCEKLFRIALERVD